MDLAHRPAVELARAVWTGELSSRELLDHFLARIERWNPALRAIVTLDVERARRRAADADDARARGECWGPLHGLPITVKDCFETAGMRTTCGAAQYADHVPLQDAAGVARLVAAGAIVFGKSNTPALAMDWQTYNELHGTTRNPWDPERSPGGSSGGSAVAMAAGFSALELGSDIGGSIRIPAHCCGIVGHKPSWGVVPTRGHLPGAPGTLAVYDLRVCGPLARSVADLELSLDLLAGPLPDRATAWRLALPAPRAAALGDYRVAAWLDDEAAPLDDTVRAPLEALVETLRSEGVSVDDHARPALNLGEAVRVYQRLLAPIMALPMPREQFEAVAIQGGALAEGSQGTFADFLRFSAASHVDWHGAHEARERMRGAWAELFAEYDVLLCPVSPVAAIPHDQSDSFLARTMQVNGSPRPYIDHFNWIGPVGAALLPATVVPVGRTPGGLPVGVQIVGPYLEDRTPLDVARRLESLLGGFEPPPGY
jgi:amidase